MWLIVDLDSRIVKVAVGGGVREKESVTVRGTTSLGSLPVRWSPGVEPLWVREEVFRCVCGRRSSAAMVGERRMCGQRGPDRVRS